MIALYTDNITPRIAYIISALFNEAVDLYDDSSAFQNASGIKINYSNKVLPNSFQVGFSGILAESEIRPIKIELFHFQDLPVFFKAEGDLPFDIFSAAFYLLSRYEEYLPHQTDEYTRFAHTESIAFKNKFLKIPLINLWLAEFWKLLNQKFLLQNKKHAAFQFIPTYDIDIAYSFSNHSKLRNAGGFLKDIFRLDGENFQRRFQTLFTSATDPFDVYDWLDDLHQQFKLSPIYFFLVAEKRKGYDKNISPNTIGMKQLIQKTAFRYKTGIHPSWQSGNDELILKNEVDTLEKLTHKRIELSRQHFIRLTLPETYHLLLKYGIKEDYSMGYGSINGFRASYAKSFFWYDLKNEKSTELLIRPFCFMDANSIFEQKDDIATASAELQNFHDIIKSVNGELITIFHNHFLATQPSREPWRNLYREFLRRNF